MAKIQDFGEKIGGAKKDLWKSRGLAISDLSEMNEAEREKLITKKNVIPAVDYQALKDSGIPVEVVYFYKRVIDAIPTKPEIYNFHTAEDIDKQQKGYIEFVSAIKNAVMECKTEADIKGFYKSFLGNPANGYIEKSGYYVSPTEKCYGLLTNKLLKAAQLSDYELRKMKADIIKKGFCITEKEKALSLMNVVKFGDGPFDAKFEKAWTGGGTKDVLAIPISGGKSFLHNLGDWNDISKWEKETYFVIMSNTVVDINFKTQEEAKSFMDSLAEKFAEKQDKAKEENKSTDTPKRKTAFKPESLKNIERKGTEYRTENATGQDYLDTFNFKGGEFGNWVNEAEREANLNYGFDSFKDLALVLGIQDKDITMGGALSIAFGARGSGTALAHYEPMREVINLTKMKGAGSLAHEWGHFLDNKLGMMLEKRDFLTNSRNETINKLLNTMKYKTATTEEIEERKRKEIHEKIKGMRTWIDSAIPRDKLTEEQIAKKEELINNFAISSDGDAVYKYMSKTMSDNIKALSDFSKEVLGYGLDKKTVDNISRWEVSISTWTRPNEEFKKMKSYTKFYADSKKFDEMFSKSDKGYWASDVEMFARAFACYVKDKCKEAGIRNDYLVGHAHMARTGDVIAYPVDEERKMINQCFDELISELKEKNILHERNSEKSLDDIIKNASSKTAKSDKNTNHDDLEK